MLAEAGWAVNVSVVCVLSALMFLTQLHAFALLSISLQHKFAFCVSVSKAEYAHDAGTLQFLS